MTAFQAREQTFEAGYWHDQDLAFRIRTRRDKLFGSWAAERLGLTGLAADRYALDVVDYDVTKHDANCVYDKIKADLRGAGIDVSDHRLKKKLEELLVEARRQIMREYETLAYRNDAVERLVS